MYFSKLSLFGVGAGVVALPEETVCRMIEQDVCGIVLDSIRSAGLWRLPGEHADSARIHRISPQPFSLSSTQVDTLRSIGDALLAFYAAANELYLRGLHDWVNDYLDIGKPEELIRHARMKYHRHALPPIIRPDILVTDDGFVITELDSVPGGFGHLDCLSAAYEKAGYEIVGGGRGIRDGFAEILQQYQVSQAVAAIVVSDESSDYLAEMKYLAEQLRAVGVKAWTVHPRDVTFTERGLLIEPEGQPIRINVLYRFFELFDLLNIPKAELISYAARKKLVTVTPPYKPFLEEKMLLAMAHHSALADYWREALGEEQFALLKGAIAPTYIMDNRPVPPHARIDGFEWRGGPIRDWRAICDGTQKERRLVLKPSGFSPLAWGSRGVKVGQDMSAQDWAAAVDEALTSFEKTPYVIQPFRDTSLIGVKYQGEGGEIRTMQARVRLCPYYFVIGGRARLGGVLATACPKDKKLIHGMVDAVMAPCCEAR